MVDANLEWISFVMGLSNGYLFKCYQARHRHGILRLRTNGVDLRGSQAEMSGENFKLLLLVVCNMFFTAKTV